MGHIHGENNSKKNLIFAFILNFTFAIFELIGGFYSNSFAIISDSFHDLMDSLIILVAIILETLSHNKTTARSPYGFKRLKLIGAILTNLVLIAGSIIIMSKAYGRFLHPEAVNSEIMIVFAIFGVVVNTVAALRLKSSNSKLDRSIMLHLLEDMLGWVAVLVSSIVIHFTGWFIIDPILSIMIAIMILSGAAKGLLGCLSIINFTLPKSFEIERLANIITNNDYVEYLENLKVWELDDEDYILTCDIYTKDGLDTALLIQDLKVQLTEFNITDITVNIFIIKEK